MMQSRLLADAPPQAWRNGGGVTRELLAWPSAAAAADWQLRLSVATIAQSGPFSAFPGVERWFTVLQGEGVTLQFGAEARTLGPGDAPLHFDGAAAPGCSLLGGETQDLNLMLRQRGMLQVAEVGRPWAQAASLRGLFATGPALLQTGAGAHELPGPGILFETDSAAAPWQLQHLAAGARAWWFHIEATA